jgi:glycolate oxidase iron-sulfur subunit
MSGLFSHVNDATERVLAHNGFALRVSRGQSCCGALHAHAGDLDSARALARVNVAAFEQSGADVIAVNSAGCGAMLKQYGHLLHDDPVWAARAERISARTRDISELLATVGPIAGTTPVALRVTHDPPCHQMHAQRVVSPPLAVLRAIPGLSLIPLEDADQCCGSAGIYNLVEPDTSDAVLAPKLARIADTRATVVVTGNPGCMMQLGAGLMLSGSDAVVMHPVELLARSYMNAETAS